MVARCSGDSLLVVKEPAAPQRDMYTWNKPGLTRDVIEAFLRECEGKARRDVDSKELTTFLDRQGTIQWMRGLLNLRPTEMGSSDASITG